MFVFDKEFLTIKNEATDELGHKFFDRNTPKTSVDIPFIDNCYLTEREISEKKWIADMANSGELPSQILDVYKTIAPKDTIYNHEKGNYREKNWILNTEHPLGTN